MCHSGVMHLDAYVAKLREQLAVAADAGGHEARELAERLTAPLESAVRLTLLEALSVAAEEITRELAPGAVDLRLRRGDPEFVVATPAPESPADGTGDGAVIAASGRAAAMTGPPGQPAGGDGGKGDVTDGATDGATNGAMARINLRLPEQLKARAERAAEREGLSVNAWLVRTVADTVDLGDRLDGDRRPPRRTAARGQRYTGWAR